jgi:hypothetical protein
MQALSQLSYTPGTSKEQHIKAAAQNKQPVKDSAMEIM